jgi:ATP-binding protein involved in chromosome partitioning
MAEKKSDQAREPAPSAAAPRQPEGKPFMDFLERENLGEKMDQIGRKLLVLSGKGGVGKSTVAANLAISLALADQEVGLLDADIHGPSIPTLLHLEGQPLRVKGEIIYPVEFMPNLKAMSIGFFLRDTDKAVIWRGPLKMGLLKQFLKDVAWGTLDYLVVDSPPGTGDEPLTLIQLLGKAQAAVIVTTPQEMALIDVKKCVTFCRKLNLPIIGIIENLSGFVCPHCGKTTDIFKSGGGERLARDLKLPFLGKIPIDPDLVLAGDLGEPYPKKYMGTETANIFAGIVRRILDQK